MNYIHGLAALVAVSAASSLMACVADPGVNGDAIAADEANVSEAASAMRSVRTLGPAGGRVRLYNGPGTNYGVAYTVRIGGNVTIVCSTRGQVIEGNSLWYKTSDGYWISDTNALTGSTSAVEPPCTED